MSQDELEGQDRVIAEIRDLVDAWRGFRLGGAPSPYPDQEPRYEPQAEGENALTETSLTLLRHWFRPEPHELGTPPRIANFKYWPHQRRAVETFIYLHEVRRVRRTEQLWALCGVDPLGPQRDPWAKLGAQLATGSGKTKVMSLLVAWSFLNAAVDPKNSLGFGKHALIVAPGLFVRDRLLADFRPPDREPRASVFFSDPVIPPELRSYWDLTVYDPTTCPSRIDPARGALVVTNYHQLLRESEEPSVSFTGSRAQLGIDLLFSAKDPSRLEDVGTPLADRFSESRGLLVINDEAHHVGDEPGHTAFEQRAKQKGADSDAMAWIRSLRRVHGTGTRGGRLALQVDLSATLFEEQGMAKNAPKRKGAVQGRAIRPQQLFRHTAVRYDLVNAIRDGIVKRPILERITVTKPSTGEVEEVVREGQPNAWEKYRNLIITGIQRWKKVRTQLMEEGDPRKPILFLLCESQNEAREIANFLRYGEALPKAVTDPRPIMGFPDPDGGVPLFVESDAHGQPTSTVVEIHIGEREQKDEKAWDAIRQIVNEIDRDEVVGEDGVRRPNRFNVVVSVMMLKEGWDVRNVKVIVPLRPCDSRTLTEQILGRGLRKMHPPIIEEDGSAAMRSEQLYVMEHPSFRAILDQVEEILDPTDPDDIQHTPEYIGILPKPDPVARDTFDVRLVHFEGVARIARSWYEDFRISMIPALSPRQSWLSEVPELKIQTWLQEALAGQLMAGQEFVLPDTLSFRDLDQVLDAAYVKPLLTEMRLPHDYHRPHVRAVVRIFLEQNTFALPTGVPISFDKVPSAETGRLMLGNLARPEVFRRVREALAPFLRRLMSAGPTIETAHFTVNHARDLVGYQALRRHVLDPSNKTVFVRAAHDTDPEVRLANALDRALDVEGWLYNHRQGVNFSIQYDYRGRTHRYYPDFIVRARLGGVVHNVILEVKGRFDDRDRRKALRGRWYAELLRRYDREPWHYLVLVENKPEKREDLVWWESQSVLRIEDLLRRHETLPLIPDEAPEKLRIVDRVAPDEEYRIAVPVVELGVKAGPLPEGRVAEPLGWALLSDRRALDERMFVAKIEGRSMEPRIPAGSWGLFRMLEGVGVATLSLDRRRVLVEVDSDRAGTGEGRYVLKRVMVTKRNMEGEIEEIELRSDNSSFAPIPLRASDADVVFRAEFLEVLG